MGSVNYPSVRIHPCAVHPVGDLVVSLEEAYHWRSLPEKFCLLTKAFEGHCFHKLADSFGHVARETPCGVLKNVVIEEPHCPVCPYVLREASLVEDCHCGPGRVDSVRSPRAFPVMPPSERLSGFRGKSCVPHHGVAYCAGKDCGFHLSSSYVLEFCGTEIQVPSHP